MSDFKIAYELMAGRSLKDESSFYICWSIGSTCSLPPKSKDLQHANNPRLARGTLHTPSCSVVRPTPHSAETAAVNHLWPEAKAPPPTEQTRDELSNWPGLTIFRLFCGEHSQYSEHRWLGAVSHSWQTARPPAPVEKPGPIFKQVLDVTTTFKYIRPHIKTEEEMEVLFFSKTTLSEWTGLNVLTLARSDSRKIHLFNYGQSREQYILGLQLSLGDLRLLSGPSLKEVAFRWSHYYCKIICRQNKFVSGVITQRKDQGRPQNGRLSRSFSKQSKGSLCMFARARTLNVGLD